MRVLDHLLKSVRAAALFNPEVQVEGMEDGPQRVRFGKADRCPRSVRPAGYAAQPDIDQIRDRKGAVYERKR
jgi:hypothetical protein